MRRPGALWVTRAEPGAAATAARLEALGYDVHVAPLLEVRSVGAGPLDLDGVTALAFTSANGVRAFAALEPRRDLAVFTVGEATARAAREAGFAQPHSADGDVSRLAALVAAGTSAADFVLHPAAEDAAGDLVGALSAAGRRARRVVVYRSIETPPTPPPNLASLAGVLLHSPRAADALRRWLEGRDGRGLAAYCLSAAVAQRLDGLDLATVRWAPFPNEAALLTLLSQDPP